MTPKEIEIALSELEERVDRLRALYEQYFMGYEKLEPTIPRKDVDRRFAILRKVNIRNTAQRFKLNVLTQKFNTYAMYWQRICRQIEEGTYKRHVQRAKKRFGEEAPAARREVDTSFDVELTDFEDELGGADEVDAAFEAALASAPAPAALPPVPPKAAPAPYRSAMGSVPDGVPAPEGGVKKLVRKKDGALGPATPATPFQPVGMPGAPPPAPAAAKPAPPPNRLPAALPPGAPVSSPRVPNPPLTGRLPAAPPPGSPVPMSARTPPAPPSAVRPPQPSSPGLPMSSPRLPAAPPPGAPARLPLPSSAGSSGAGVPLSSQRLPAAPPSASGSGPAAPSPSQRFPAAPPPGGPRPMIRPIPGGIRRPTPSSPDLGDAGGTGDRDED